MPSLRELWRISGYFYRDVAFRTILETNVGRKSLEKVIKSSKNSMILNKLIVAFVLCVFAVTTAYRFKTVDFVVFYIITTFIFAFFFLQTTTTFVSQKFDLLFVLPLKEEEISKIAILTFLRIFDIPLIAVTLVFVIGVALRDFRAILPAFTGIAVSVALALGIVFYMSKLFYTKLTGSASGWRSVVRLVCQIVWALSFFLIYALGGILSRLSYLEGYLVFLESYSNTLGFLFPFCYSYLCTGVITFSSLLGSILWTGLGYYSVKWVLSNIRKVQAISIFQQSDVKIKLTSPTIAFVRKDMRLISRNPAYTFLVLLPIFEGLMLSFGKFMPAVLILLSFLVVLSYSLYGLENVNVVKILPVKPKTIITAKMVIISMIYAISIAVLDTIFLVRGICPDFLFELAITPSVIAMAIVTLSATSKIGAKRDVFSGLETVLILFLLGFVVIYTPVIIGYVCKVLYGTFLMPVAVTSLVELIFSLALLNVL